LVLHEGDERGDDDGGPLAAERRHLVARRLARARGHEHERVPAGHDGVDDLGLVPAEVRVPPDPAQHVQGGLGHAPTLTATADETWARRRPAVDADLQQGRGHPGRGTEGCPDEGDRMLPCSARAGRACATDPRPALRTERTLARPDRSAPAVVDSSAPVRRFRPEIEGLRAVAALLVAIYHIFLGRVSGGVDIFFTVAGFLITLTLLRQVGSRGTVSAKVFFSRLGRRLLPASLFVLGAVAVATAVLLPSSRRSATFGEIVASVLYVENWALASKSVDYLAREEGSSPVQHFWAMSIQGQFYVIWFVLFLVAVWLGAHRIRTTLRWILGGLFVASFGFSIYLTALDQPLAYFHTGTRVWEFAAG